MLLVMASQDQDKRNATSHGGWKGDSETEKGSKFISSESKAKWRVMYLHMLLFKYLHVKCPLIIVFPLFARLGAV